MKIATYNMLEGGSQRGHWVTMIEDFGMDLLLVQESYRTGSVASPRLLR